MWYLIFSERVQLDTCYETGGLDMWLPASGTENTPTPTDALVWTPIQALV